MAVFSPSGVISRRRSERSSLYRIAWAAVIFELALGLSLPQTGFAQVGRRPAPDKGPRALGLLELPAKGKAHLIPIAIMIDGEFYDASAYKAAPVPMALEAGTVYEAERTGVSLGLFTVTAALESNDKNWMAEGTWQSAEAIQAKAAKKPAPSKPRGLDEDEGPPKLRRAAPAPQSTPDASAPQKTASPAASQNQSASQNQPAPQPTPPATAAQTSPQQNASSSSSAPAVSNSGAQAGVASGAPPPSESKDDDKNRPMLHRGKPSAAELKKEAEAEDSSAPSASAASAASRTATQAASNSPGAAPDAIQIIPAISDAHSPEARPYTYILKPDEEQHLRQKILALAAVEVRARDEKLASATTGAGQPGAHPTRAAGKNNAAKPPGPAFPDMQFEDVQLRVFDLFSSNEPELVLMAKARMPRSKESAAPERQYLVTVVAHEDIYGDLHKALANVTDTQHLDVIPRLDLIDAVDADGDGRGELLFRQVSDAGSAYVIYRVIGDQLWALFQGTPQ
jgi:hypothetical protein